MLSWKQDSTYSSSANTLSSCTTIMGHWAKNEAILWQVDPKEREQQEFPREWQNSGLHFYLLHIGFSFCSELNLQPSFWSHLCWPQESPKSAPAFEFSLHISSLLLLKRSWHISNGITFWFLKILANFSTIAFLFSISPWKRCYCKSKEP